MPDNPTSTQRRALVSLTAKPGRYIRDRFDGGCALCEADGEIENYGPHGGTIDACAKRGWITYSVHQYGSSLAMIERRYTITESGVEAIHASR